MYSNISSFNQIKLQKIMMWNLFFKPFFQINTNGQWLPGVVALPKSFNHHAPWEVVHPYFEIKKRKLGCIQSIDWFLNVTTRKCQQISIPCRHLAIHFWKDLKTCLDLCTVKRVGVKPIAKINLDPKVVCIIPWIKSKTDNIN